MTQVSVVIPVYNGEPFVARAARSALAQTVRNIEVLVADNGSTDGTWNVLQGLAGDDARVRPLRLPPGGGPDVSRNACIDAAKGEWVAMLDADDLMHPSRLERLLAFAAARNADVVADNLRLVDARGGVLCSAWRPGELPGQVDAAAFVLGNLFGQSSMSLGYLKPMVRRRLLNELGLRYAAEPRLVEDYQFMFALLRTGAVLHLLAEPLYDFVQTPGSLSRSSFNRVLPSIRLANAAHLAAAQGNARLREALLQRQRTLDDALAHDAFVRALKAVRPDQAILTVLRRPSAMPLVVRFGKESIAKRLARLTGKPSCDGCTDAPALAAYFGQDCTDNAVIRRVSAFQAEGLAVLGFTFRRRKFNLDFIPTWDNVALGETRDRDYRGRLWQMVKAAATIFRRRRDLSRASFLYARNIDTALLAWFGRLVSGSQAPLVYEVLDVQRAFLGSGATAALLRWVERRLLARSRLLVVSSPAFVREYFRPIQGYRGEWFLQENKIVASQLKTGRVSRPAGSNAALQPDGRWTIGWFGTLRCTRSLEILERLADALPGQVRVYLRGFPTETGLGPFLEAVCRHPNMLYGGEFFSPRDLPELYGAIDFAWGFDFLDAGANSDWLLPNRYYDAGCHNVPVLAAAGSETGRRVGDLGMGWTFSPPYELSLIEFFRTITLDSVAERRAHIASLPRALFCEEGDTGRLVQTILRGGRAADFSSDPAWAKAR